MNSAYVCFCEASIRKYLELEIVTRILEANCLTLMNFPDQPQLLIIDFFACLHHIYQGFKDTVKVLVEYFCYEKEVAREKPICVLHLCRSDILF